MKFSAERETLMAMLNASRALPTHTPMVVLEGVLLEAVDDKLICSGYGDFSSRITSSDVNIQEDGSIVVPSKLFNDIVKKLKDGIITLESDTEFNILIKSGRSTFNITGLSPEDYPEIPFVSTEASMKFKSGELKRAIGEIIYAMSEDETKPTICGALFERTDDSNVAIVAMDGFRMGCSRVQAVDIDAPKDYQIILHKKPLVELLKSLPDNDALASIDVGPRHILAKIEDESFIHEIIGKKVTGTYPGWRVYFGKKDCCHIVLDRQSFLACVGRVRVVIKDGARLRLNFGPDSTNLMASAATARAKDMVVPGKSDLTDTLDMAVNAGYLFDVLSSLPGKNVSLELVSPVSPIVITSYDDNPDTPVGGKHLLLPMRLEA
jgi:DNA polymerase-3 subunit beta